MTLTVTDNDGGEDTATLNLAVSEVLPKRNWPGVRSLPKPGRSTTEPPHWAAATSTPQPRRAMVAVNLTTHQIDWRFDLDQKTAPPWAIR